MSSDDRHQRQPLTDFSGPERRQRDRARSPVHVREGDIVYEPVCYRVDSHSRLMACSPAFDAFAEANGAPALTTAQVLGRSLFEFCTPEVGHLFRLLMERVRRQGTPVIIPFRCDGPSVRRYMQLTVRPLGDGQLEFVSALYCEEGRDTVSLLSDKRGTLVVMCSWCKQVRMADSWVEIEVAVSALHVFDGALTPQISHGICPGCAEALEHAAGEPNLLPWAHTKGVRNDW